MSGLLSQEVYDRALGAWYGQIIGDNQGAHFEFKEPSQIDVSTLHTMHDGGYWKLIAGQGTDDTEMALALARSLLRRGGFDKDDVLASYKRWARDVFDIGATCSAALLSDVYSPESQANGALMRSSPIGIAFEPQEAARIAALDCVLTHIHPHCVELNSRYARALSTQIRHGIGRMALAQLLGGERELPEDFVTHMGFVDLAFGVTVFEVAHAQSFEQGLLDVIARGGDTDTNAAIAGAMLGALFGAEAIPLAWREAVDHARPGPATSHPRPEEYWTCDARELAYALVELETVAS